MEGILSAIIETVTAPIPFLASSGILLLVFATLWAAFAIALVRQPDRVDAVWRRLRSWPLVVQAAAWLLLLPVLLGIVVWRTTWPTVARLVIVGGIALWNLLVFLPATG
jgi:hypothetical protein